MFLHLNSAQKEIQEKVRTLVASEIAPKAGEIDARDEFPENSYEAFVRAGLLKLSLPAAFGGKEADATSLCLVIEEISKASPASALLVFPTNAVVRTIREVGTPEQKERFFSDMSPGDKLCGLLSYGTQLRLGCRIPADPGDSGRGITMWLTVPRPSLP